MPRITPVGVSNPDRARARVMLPQRFRVFAFGPRQASAFVFAVILIGLSIAFAPCPPTRWNAAERACTPLPGVRRLSTDKGPSRPGFGTSAATPPPVPDRAQDGNSASARCASSDGSSDGSSDDSSDDSSDGSSDGTTSLLGRTLDVESAARLLR